MRLVISDAEQLDYNERFRIALTQYNAQYEAANQYRLRTGEWPVPKYWTYLAPITRVCAYCRTIQTGPRCESCGAPNQA